MIITIQATLTEEQALLLAKEKWYSETITNIVDNTVFPAITEQITNPETSFEFLKRVYEAMIVQDATSLYLAVYERDRRQEQEAEVNALKEQVISSITSSVE